MKASVIGCACAPSSTRHRGFGVTQVFRDSSRSRYAVRGRLRSGAFGGFERYAHVLLRGKPTCLSPQRMDVRRRSRKWAAPRGLEVLGFTSLLCLGWGAQVRAADESTWVESVPVQSLRAAPRVAEVGEQTGVVYVNFEGGRLRHEQGRDDASKNITFLEEMDGEHERYGGGAKQAAVLEAVRSDWADYNVVVVDQRPGGGAYTMAMVGPTNPYGERIRGMAPLDCEDRWSKKNIVFAFFESDDDYTVSATAGIISQELAHSFGLDHVDDERDVMHPRIAGGDPRFVDECLPVVEAETSDGNVVSCADAHLEACPQGGRQNSHRELLERFGPPRTDTEAPSVAVAWPPTGARFGAGSDIEVEVDATDDTAISLVRLVGADGELWAEDDAEPFGWIVRDTEPGRYRFRVEAQDLEGNLAWSDWVELTVERGSGGEGGSGDDALDVEPNGSWSDAEPIEGGSPEDALGCACSTSSRPGPLGTAALSLALLLLARRRRDERTA